MYVYMYVYVCMYVSMACTPEHATRHDAPLRASPTCFTPRQRPSSRARLRVFFPAEVGSLLAERMRPETAYGPTRD